MQELDKLKENMDKLEELMARLNFMLKEVKSNIRKTR